MPRLLVVLSWMVLLVALAAPVSGADPSPAPSPTPSPTDDPRTCAQRYPIDGPGGVNLQIACIVVEFVAADAKSEAKAEAQARIASGFGPVVVLVSAAVVAWIAVQWMSRRTGARLAPTQPARWWSCTHCRSLTAIGITNCYRCGQPWTADAL
ncbi:MAG: hypothetical protein ABI555_01580, partial [Chloroflexota bacterium]